MQRFQHSARSQSDGIWHTPALFTKRRLAYSLAGAFLFAAAAAAAHSTLAAQRSDEPKAQNRTTQNTPAAADTADSQTQLHSDGTSLHTSFSSTTTNGATQSSLQVNGQDIAMAADGHTEHTIRDANGTTVVNTTTTGSGSDVSVQVRSESTSSGGESD